MKAIIFEENVYDNHFVDEPHIHRAIADLKEDKFHVCQKCENFIFKGIVIPEAGNLRIELWTDFASRYLGTVDFCVAVFMGFKLTRACRIIGEIEIPNPEVLVRRATQFDKIDGFWNSHKSRVGIALRKALYKDAEELLKKAQPQPASQPS